MKATMRALGFAAALLAAWAGPVQAHHSFAMFDHSKPVKLDGTIKELKWQNPHVWIQMMAPQAPGGAPIEWSIEGGSVNILARNGWSATVVKPGDKISLMMFPLRSGVSGGSLISLTTGGKTFNGH